jgi:hypothetical protein
VPWALTTDIGNWIKTQGGIPLFYLCNVFRHPLDRFVVAEYLDLNFVEVVYGEEWTTYREPTVDD